VLGHPSFAFLLCSRVLANMGFHMLGVAVGWQLYALTGSALDLGLVGLAQFLPIVLLTLLVGQVADRCDRRLIAVVCQLVEAAAALALVAATVTGRQSNTTILAIVALIGAARAFESPATTALVSDVVPRPLIARAMAWLVSANQTAQIVGPALGGFLSARSPEAAYVAAASLFVVAGMCAAVIRSRRGPRAVEPLTLESVFSGVAFIWSRRVLLGTMSLDLFAVLLGGATALLPVYARDILDAGPRGGSDSCARPRPSAPWRRRSSSPAIRCGGESGPPSFVPSCSSGRPRSCSASPPASRSRSSPSPFSARRTWSAWSSGPRSSRSGRRTRCAAA